MLTRRSILVSLVLIVVAAFAGGGIGCSKATTLVSAPNLYTQVDAEPYAQVPEALRTTTAKVVYATDRAATTKSGSFQYTANRSRTTAYGVATVRLGAEDATWDGLVRTSTREPREGHWPLSVSGIEEIGRFPRTAMSVLVDGRWVEDPEHAEAMARETAQLHALLAEQLALTPTKELFVFVHGYNNTFDSGAFRAAQIWHFVGRGGVPVLFSWPAGSTGLLQGYTRDRESGEFANPHLKMFLRALASCPEVKKINLIAHSRGTDILTTAVRELHLEYRGAGLETRTQLKIGQMVLAAPDLDMQVTIERFGADRLATVPEQLTMYVSQRDKAIGLSTWLFGSVERIGKLKYDDLDPDVQAIIKKHPVMSIVDVLAKTDRTGHGYFLSSPAVLSDLILVLRDGRKPGADNGRPLFDNPAGFWELNQGYPFRQQAIKAASTQPTSAN